MLIKLIILILWHKLSLDHRSTLPSMSTTIHDYDDTNINSGQTTPVIAGAKSKGGNKPVLFRVSLQESTKRLTNMLHIRSLVKQTNSTSSSTSPPETKRSSKFLRSNSTNFTNNSKTGGDGDPQTMSRKQLLQSDQLDRECLNTWLCQDLDELINHFEAASNETSEQTAAAQLSGLKFMETNEVSSTAYLQLASHARHLMVKCDFLCKQLETSVHLYDFSENVKANGYRSLIKVYDSCCRHMLMLVNELNEKKNTFFFQLKLISSKPLPKLNTNLKEFQAWVSVKFFDLEDLRTNSFDVV